MDHPIPKSMMRYGLVLLVGLTVSVGCGSSNTDSTSSSENSASSPPPNPPSPPGARVYTTNFPLFEAPLSEGGNWINGKTTGLVWADFSSTPGLAIGTQSGTNPALYDDSIALVTGTWGADQTVQAVVKTVNQNNTIFEEVELLLRFKITAHSARGYEVNFRCTHDGTQHTQVIRWNGPLGGFSLLDSRAGPGISNGDTVKATIVSSLITVYINNVAIFSVNDTTFTSGNPGIGAFLASATGVNGDYGFTSFTASD